MGGRGFSFFFLKGGGEMLQAKIKFRLKFFNH